MNKKVKINILKTFGCVCCFILFYKIMQYFGFDIGTPDNTLLWSALLSLEVEYMTEEQIEILESIKEIEEERVKGRRRNKDLAVNPTKWWNIEIINYKDMAIQLF